MPRISAVLAALFVPTLLAAQGRPGGGPQETRGAWAPAVVGLRAGYDYNSTGTLLGAHVRLPVLPSGHVEFVPYGDITFLTGLKEYQGGVEAVFVSGGRRGGIYGGGGIAWRNTIYEGAARETRRAPTLVVGARSGALFGAPFGTQVEMRWTYPEGQFKPRSLMLGVNFPLWGRRGGRN